MAGIITLHAAQVLPDQFLVNMRRDFPGEAEYSPELKEIVKNLTSGTPIVYAAAGCHGRCSTKITVSITGVHLPLPLFRGCFKEPVPLARRDPAISRLKYCCEN
jgi:hypothetical protein